LLLRHCCLFNLLLLLVWLLLLLFDYFNRLGRARLDLLLDATKDILLECLALCLRACLVVGLVRRLQLRKLPCYGLLVILRFGGVILDLLVLLGGRCLCLLSLALVLLVRLLLGRRRRFGVGCGRWRCARAGRWVGDVCSSR
jgi:hypothetical protein